MSTLLSCPLTRFGGGAASLSPALTSAAARLRPPPAPPGDCDGAVKGSNGQPIKIPCSCPPDRTTFLQSLQADIAAGHAVHNPSVALTFPTDNSPNSQRARINAASIALQNLNGSGVGCPIVSTTFQAQAAAIQG